eukprot:RCo044794
MRRGVGKGICRGTALGRGESQPSPSSMTQCLHCRRGGATRWGWGCANANGSDFGGDWKALRGSENGGEGKQMGGGRSQDAQELTEIAISSGMESCAPHPPTWGSEEAEMASRCIRSRVTAA